MMMENCGITPVYDINDGNKITIMAGLMAAGCG